MSDLKLDDIVSFAKQHGFVFQGSEIYGGLANTWDYGPLGVEMKNNIKKAWWKKFVQEEPENVGLDSSILLNDNVWKASGHLSGFSDPLTDCKKCNTRHRADKLIEDFTNGEVIGDGMSNDEMINYIKEHNIVCPNCGELDYTEIRQFNLMFKTSQGVVDDEGSVVHLRPETAQGIFINFKNIQRATRKKVPFGVGQIGKSFRNEITPGNFIFRTREFEQMELEFFCKPGTELEWYKYFVDKCSNFLLDLGIKREEFRVREHDPEELSHYSNATTDIEYKFPWAISELWGIASRTNYDLNAHMSESKQSLEYLDPETNEKYLPYVIEPAVGVDRLLLALLTSAYEIEPLEDGETREVLRLHPAISPYKVAVLPLIKKLHSEKAREIYASLSKYYSVTYDDAAKIGKRYRRQDAIGTPFVITIDDDTLNNNTVTLRDRDTMEQVTINLDNLIGDLDSKLFF